MIYYGRVRVTEVESALSYDSHRMDRVYVENLSDAPADSGLLGPGFMLKGEQTPADVEVGDELECIYSEGSTAGGYLLQWPTCRRCGHYRRHARGGPDVCEECVDSRIGTQDPVGRGR